MDSHELDSHDYKKYMKGTTTVGIICSDGVVDRRRHSCNDGHFHSQFRGKEGVEDR